MEELKKQLSEFGTIEVIKNEFVFTLFMRVENANQETVFGVLGLVTKTITDKPNIEVMKNDNDFILIVLKPKTSHL
nr:hypothetical protein [uncultured Flavobacterium sp.]